MRSIHHQGEELRRQNFRDAPVLTGTVFTSPDVRLAASRGRFVFIIINWYFKNIFYSFSFELFEMLCCKLVKFN